MPAGIFDLQDRAAPEKQAGATNGFVRRAAAVEPHIERDRIGTLLVEIVEISWTSRVTLRKPLSPRRSASMSR